LLSAVKTSVQLIYLDEFKPRLNFRYKKLGKEPSPINHFALSGLTALFPHTFAAKSLERHDDLPYQQTE
jgi:hypothetical protein